MKAAKINARAYGKLLVETLPHVIRNDAELDKATALLLKLDEIEEAGKLTPEQDLLTELLLVLVERYESEHYPIDFQSSPHDNLVACMENRGTTQAEIAELLGSRSIASEILRGRREISKANAKKLAEYFRAPADLFI